MRSSGIRTTASRNHSCRSVRLSLHFHSWHHHPSQAKSFPETLACVTRARGGGELFRFRVRSVLDELQSSPDATMYDYRMSVRSLFHSLRKILSWMSIHTIVISTGMVLCMMGT